LGVSAPAGCRRYCGRVDECLCVGQYQPGPGEFSGGAGAASLKLIDERPAIPAWIGPCAGETDGTGRKGWHSPDPGQCAWQTGLGPVAGRPATSAIGPDSLPVCLLPSA